MGRNVVWGEVDNVVWGEAENVVWGENTYPDAGAVVEEFLAEPVSDDAPIVFDESPDPLGLDSLL